MRSRTSHVACSLRSGFRSKRCCSGTSAGPDHSAPHLLPGGLVLVYWLGGSMRIGYLPQRRKKWKDSTDQTTTERIQTHLLKAFENFELTDFSRYRLQQLLDQKARSLSRSVVSHDNARNSVHLTHRRYSNAHRAHSIAPFMLERYGLRTMPPNRGPSHIQNTPVKNQHFQTDPLPSAELLIPCKRDRR